MILEVLLSTMYQNDHGVIERLGLECDAVVVNQCDRNSVERFEYQGHKITWINSSKRGLSCSRNMALANSKADICLLVDDDEELIAGYSKIILKAFERHSDADIIGFQAEGIESVFKNYFGKEGRVGYVHSMRMASVEIAFKRQSLRERHISFNENIGAGTKYKMGEENTLLFNCLSAGLNIYYVPELICRIHIGDSTWFSGYDDDYFHARGAVFTAMSRRWANLLILQFAVRKYKLYKDSIGILKACRLMLDGKRDYIKNMMQK